MVERDIDGGKLPTVKKPAPGSFTVQGAKERVLLKGLTSAPAVLTGVEGAGFASQYVEPKDSRVGAIAAGFIAGNDLARVATGPLTLGDKLTPMQHFDRFADATGKQQDEIRKTAERDGKALAVGQAAVAFGAQAVGAVAGLTAPVVDPLAEAVEFAGKSLLVAAVPSDVRERSKAVVASGADRLAAAADMVSSLSSPAESRRLKEQVAIERAERREAKSSANQGVAFAAVPQAAPSLMDRAKALLPSPPAASRDDAPSLPAPPEVQVTPIDSTVTVRDGAIVPVTEVEDMGFISSVKAKAASVKEAVKTAARQDLLQAGVMSGATTTGAQVGPGIPTFTTPGDEVRVNVAPTGMPDSMRLALTAGATALGLAGGAAAVDLARGEKSAIRKGVRKARGALKGRKAKKSSKRQKSKARKSARKTMKRASPKKAKVKRVSKPKKGGVRKGRREDAGGAMRGTWRGKQVYTTKNGQPYVYERRKNPITGKVQDMPRFIPR